MRITKDDMQPGEGGGKYRQEYRFEGTCPAGTYEATVAEVIPGVTKGNPPSAKLETMFEVDTDYPGTRTPGGLLVRLHAAKGWLKALLDATGFGGQVAAAEGDIDFDEQQLVGKRVRVVLKLDENPGYAPRMQVRTVLPPGPVSVPASAKAPASSAKPATGPVPPGGYGPAASDEDDDLPF